MSAQQPTFEELEQAIEQQQDKAQDSNEDASNTQKVQAAKAVVSKYMGWGAGAGAMPVPFWDVVAIGSVQTLMLKEIFAVYEVNYQEKKLRSVVTLLLGAVSPGMLAGVAATTFMKLIPGVGSVLAAVSLPVLASASTYAVGNVMIQHLEKGGNLDNFNVTDYKDKFAESVEKGKAMLRRKNAENQAA